MSHMNQASVQQQAHAQESGDARIRVLLFTNSIVVGGMEEHVELLARDLDRQQFEVYAICPDWPQTAPFGQSLARLADRFAMFTPDHRYGLLKLYRDSIRLYRQIRRWGIQVMHMHSTTYRGQYYALLAARLAGVRAIYVTEHLAPEQRLPPLELLTRNAFSALVDGIVCVSQKNFAARAAHIYTPAERTTVVNNGVDLGDFPPIDPATLASLRKRYRIPAHAQVVGTAVRFEPEKGLEYLIDAMPIIRSTCPDAYFLMVGDGTLRAQLERQVDALGMGDYVRFTGFQDDPRPFLGLMDAFVLPVPVGSMSIGLLEAMAMQRAVVMTFGGTGEAVIHGENGFCAEPRSAESIALYVTQLLNDPALRMRLGTAARQRIESDFSSQQVAEKLSQIYRHGRS
ncbi:glycosyltransferase family 4 protein [Chloroflexia bacterium SDU3-3]|nr:glycosyltransferase family 4 protein [Chloroflexia bacterium SDU3-3]